MARQSWEDSRYLCFRWQSWASGVEGHASLALGTAVWLSDRGLPVPPHLLPIAGELSMLFAFGSVDCSYEFAGFYICSGVKAALFTPLCRIL